MSQFSPNGSANEPRPSARYNHRKVRPVRIAQQGLFGLTATLSQRLGLPAVQLDALFFLQALSDRIRKGEVHIVTAEKNVVPHGDTKMLKGATLVELP